MGMVTAFTRYAKNTHRVLRELRAAAFYSMGFRDDIPSEYPAWDEESNKVVWKLEVLTPRLTSTTTELMGRPREAFLNYFPNFFQDYLEAKYPVKGFENKVIQSYILINCYVYQQTRSVKRVGAEVSNEQCLAFLDYMEKVQTTYLLEDLTGIDT